MGDFQKIVEDGGGIFRGLQEGLGRKLVLFDSPITGSTLGVYENELTPQAVKEKIAESDRKFRSARRKI